MRDHSVVLLLLVVLEYSNAIDVTVFVFRRKVEK